MRFLVWGMYALVRRWARRGLRRIETAEEAEEGRERRRIGRRGELLAYWFLRREGYVIIRRNFRPPSGQGDIDLVAWDGRVLAFIEVKTRTTEPGNAPEEVLTDEQRGHLLRSARYYLKRRGWSDVPYRFDLVAIDQRSGSLGEPRLYRDVMGR